MTKWLKEAYAFTVISAPLVGLCLASYGLGARADWTLWACWGVSLYFFVGVVVVLHMD